MQYLDFREPQQHGMFGFPVALYHVNKGHPRYVMNCHWHVECELIYIKKGSLNYVVDTEQGRADVGDILFVNSGFLHSGKPEGCDYDCLLFDLGMLLKSSDAGLPALKEIAEHRMLVNMKLPKEDAKLYRIINDLYETAECVDSKGKMLQIKGLLFQFLGYVIEKGYLNSEKDKHRSSSRKIGKLKQTLELMEGNYGRMIALEELADAAGMTPKYFCRFFREMTGRTPIDYLNFHRVEIACQQLAGGDFSVTEIAYDCGFNDLSYFIRVFKKYKGKTPTDYMKRISESGARGVPV